MSAYQRIVIKLGTSTLTDQTQCLSRRRMVELTRQLVLLYEQGKSVVLVTSGAVGAGRELFPHLDGALPVKQMLASVGQVRLMHTWSEFFANYDVVVGQILLSRADFANRRHYLNVRDTALAMLEHRMIPIVNENDTVATKRLRFGDNDRLAALFANLIDADLLALMTDQEGLYTADPRVDSTAKLLSVVEEIDASVMAMAAPSASSLGTGGMMTKIEAARLAVESGTETVIASSLLPDILLRIVGGQQVGTRFPARETPLESRKRWLLSEPRQGSVLVDQGAVSSLAKKGASLLPVGVVNVEGEFDRGAIIDVLGPDRGAIGVGLSNYSSEEIGRLSKRQSQEIVAILGYSYGDEIIHRDNLTVMKGYVT